MLAHLHGEYFPVRRLCLVRPRRKSLATEVNTSPPVGRVTRVLEGTRITRVNQISRSVTADTALMLATVFGNTADFWLKLQQRNDLWKALNTPKRRARIDKAKPIAA